MSADDRHVPLTDLESGLDRVQRAPLDEGTVELIVRRPSNGEREILAEATLDLESGLVGDNWRVRGSSKTEDGSAHPGKQITLMSARVIALLAGEEKARWAMSGDQLFVDLHLGADSLPPGTRLAVGGAEIEVSAEPHIGCKKFVERFGRDAMDFINTPLGRELRMRGLNARVVKPGVVHVGDVVKRVPA